MKIPLIDTISFRHLFIAIFLINLSILAWKDSRAKEIYFDLAKIAIGGYLGQLLPQKES